MLLGLSLWVLWTRVIISGALYIVCSDPNRQYWRILFDNCIILNIWNDPCSQMSLSAWSCAVSQWHVSADWWLSGVSLVYFYILCRVFEAFESRTPPSLHINTRINSDRKLKVSADICDSPSWQESFQQGENTVSPSAASTALVVAHRPVIPYSLHLYCLMYS